MFNKKIKSFLYFFSFSLPAIVFTSCDYSKNKEQEFIKIEQKYFNFDLIEYKKEDYFLSKNGLQKFYERIKKDLFYGSEINFLNKIIIDKNLKEFSNTKERQGFFISNTREIYLNSDSLQNIKNEDDRIEVLFQILYHEYFHYIDSTYLSNYKQGYTIKNSKSTKTYNKEFIDNFLSDLRITDDRFSNYFPNKNLLNSSNIFNDVTIKEILEKSLTNKLNEINFENKNLQIMNEKFKNLNNFIPLSYYFSFEEFFANEAYKHFYIEKRNNLNNDKNFYLNDSLWTTTLTREDGLTHLEDNFIINDSAFGGYITKNDSVIKLDNKIKDLFIHFLEIMNYKLNISGIYNLNNRTYINDKLEANIDNNKLFFSGYTKEKYDGLIFKNKENSFIKLNLVYNESNNLKAKLNKNDQDYSLFPEEKYLSYYTNSYLNMEEMNMDFKPMLWKDLNNNGKIEEKELHNLNNFSSNSNYGPSSSRSFLTNSESLTIRNNKIIKE
ncbi:MYPU_1760 family metalloprotease [Mycoplasma sp. Z386]